MRKGEKAGFRNEVECVAAAKMARNNMGSQKREGMLLKKSIL